MMSMMDELSQARAKNASARSRAQIKRRERGKLSVRAKVEHAFAVARAGSDTGRQDTEVCKSRPLN